MQHGHTEGEFAGFHRCLRTRFSHLFRSWLPEASTSNAPIEDIEGFGPKGISGTLSGVNAKGWPGGWHTDPAALDGGLQLAVLWDREMLDGAFLPTGIGAYVPHQRANADGPLRCIVSGKTVGKDRSITDILFTDADGLPVAELRGVETHRRPSGV